MQPAVRQRASGERSSPISSRCSRYLKCWCIDFTDSVQRRTVSDSGRNKWSIYESKGDNGIISVCIGDLLEMSDKCKAFHALQDRISKHMPKSSCCTRPVLGITIYGYLITDPTSTSVPSWPGAAYPVHSKMRAIHAMDLIKSMKSHDIAVATHLHGTHCSALRRSTPRSSSVSHASSVSHVVDLGALQDVFGTFVSQPSLQPRPSARTIASLQRRVNQLSQHLNPANAIRPPRGTVLARMAAQGIANRAISTTVSDVSVSRESSESSDDTSMSSDDTSSSATLENGFSNPSVNLLRPRRRATRRLIPVMENRRGLSDERGVQSSSNSDDDIEVEIVMSSEEDVGRPPAQSHPQGAQQRSSNPRIAWENNTENASNTATSSSTSSQILRDMGFTLSDINRALQETNGDIHLAINGLLGQDT